MKREEAVAYLDTLTLPWKKVAPGVYTGNYGTFNRHARVRVGKMYIMFDLFVNDNWLNVSKQNINQVCFCERGNNRGKLLIGTNPL